MEDIEAGYNKKYGELALNEKNLKSIMEQLKKYCTTLEAERNNEK